MNCPNLAKVVITIGIISGFASFSYGEKEPNTGVGFQIASAGISGLSVKHWSTPKMGFQFIFGGWKKGGDYFIDFGGGILYKVSDKKRTDAYFGVGAGGFKEVNEYSRGDEVEEAFGIEAIFGAEHFWGQLGGNLEVGFTIGKKIKSYQWKDDKKETVFGVGFGMGIHYYF